MMTFPSPHATLRWASCGLLAGSLSAWAAPTTSPAKPGEFGQTLVMEANLTDAQVARFNAFKPSKPDPNESALVNALAAETENWFGEAMTMEPTANPYTLVVTLEGTARADGDVATLWQAGWKLEDGGGKLQAFPGLTKLGVKAGEHVVITRAAPPSQFKEAKLAAPMLGLVRADNFSFEHVTVQLWSGFPATSKTQWLLSFRGALVGLVMIVVILLFRRRR